MSDLLLSVLAGAFVVLLAVGFLVPPRDVEAELITDYLTQHPGDRDRARAALEERLATLAQRYPGKSRAWRLRWLLTDLRRAKR